MDLSKYDNIEKASEEGAPLYLKDPTGEPMVDETTGRPVTITLRGRDSETVRKEAHRMAKRQIKEQAGAAPMSEADRLKASALDVLAAATVGWDGIIVEGKRLAFSTEEARALYERYAFVTEQVDAFFSYRGNFLGNSPTGS